MGSSLAQRLLMGKQLMVGDGTEKENPSQSLQRFERGPQGGVSWSDAGAADVLQAIDVNISDEQLNLIHPTLQLLFTFCVRIVRLCLSRIYRRGILDGRRISVL